MCGRIRLAAAAVLSAALTVGVVAVVEADELRAYERPNELAPLPEGTASLYYVPWRANPRTVSAHEALKGPGIYYKYTPGTWTEQDHIRVMKQLHDAGVRRLRITPHHAVYISAEWTEPKPQELQSMRKKLRAAHAAGIRPVVTFVHIPPFGEPGTDELQRWWHRQWNTELLPVGEVGSEEFDAYLDKTFLALRYILDEARNAGFTEEGSYDLEMGQGVWWGAPATPGPIPATLEDFKVGGRINTFERMLIERVREEGYLEPTLWWGMTHHVFEQKGDEDIPSLAHGQAISFYDPGLRWAQTYLNVRRGEGGAMDDWPVRELSWLEGFEDSEAPAVVLARPEGWMADRSRRDNLIELMRDSKLPVAMTAVGTTPADIPNVRQADYDGWEIKQRGITRMMAFWLNQGAETVLFHSFHQADRAGDGEMTFSVLPTPLDPQKVSWRDGKPLVALRAFTEGLVGAVELEEVLELTFRFALDNDPELIPSAGDAGPMRANDLIAILPYQVDAKTFAVAAYILTPNVAARMEPLTLTLEMDKALSEEEVTTLRPATGERGKAEVIERNEASARIRAIIHDDPIWIRFRVK